MCWPVSYGILVGLWSLGDPLCVLSDDWSTGVWTRAWGQESGRVKGQGSGSIALPGAAGCRMRPGGALPPRRTFLNQPGPGVSWSLCVAVPAALRRDVSCPSSACGWMGSPYARCYLVCHGQEGAIPPGTQARWRGRSLWMSTVEGHSEVSVTGNHLRELCKKSFRLCSTQVGRDEQKVVPTLFLKTRFCILAAASSLQPRLCSRRSERGLMSGWGLRLPISALLLSWAQAPEPSGLSGCGAQAPEHRLSSCGPQALFLHGMWDLPGSGMEPVSPTLVGGLLTTEPPGKPRTHSF